MPKPTPNQAAALQGLTAAIADKKVAYVGVTQWKKFVSEGTQVTSKSLVGAGLVEEIEVLVGQNPTKVYRPKA